MDSSDMDDFREYKRNLRVACYDYPYTCKMVRCDWMERVYRWMLLPEKVWKKDQNTNIVMKNLFKNKRSSGKIRVRR